MRSGRCPIGQTRRKTRWKGPRRCLLRGPWRGPSCGAARSCSCSGRCYSLPSKDEKCQSSKASDLRSGRSEAGIHLASSGTRSEVFCGLHPAVRSISLSAGR